MTPSPHNAYGRDAVLTASPAALLNMLYDRLVLDLRRAEVAQAEERWQAASEQLLHAQAIVSELMGSLKVDAWSGGKDLMALYVYVHQALVSANIHRDIARTREALGLVVPLQETWRQAAQQMPARQLGVGAETGTLGSINGVA